MSWLARAKCTDSDSELWFSDDPFDRQWAKRVCRTCPVSSECLLFAMENEGPTKWHRSGIWGGLDEDERARLVKEAV